MRYDPVMAALIKERGASHPDYAAVLFQEKVIALAHAGKVNLRQRPAALLAQVRGIIRHERQGQVAHRLVRPKRLRSRSGDPNAIVDDVCLRHGIDRQELLGPGRRQKAATARFELFYRLRTETSLSYKVIGQVAGGRHHATVMHGIRQWCHLNRLPHPDHEERPSCRNVELHRVTPFDPSTPHKQRRNSCCAST